MEIYFEEEIIYFDDDPLIYWKKKSEELPTLAALAKEYLGPTVTSRKKDFSQSQEIFILLEEIC